MAVRIKKHEEIYEKIRTRIASGDLASGSKLSNERTLAAEHGVAVMTLRRALDRLEEEGHLIRRPYHGTTVAAGDRASGVRRKNRKFCVGLVVPVELTALSHPVFSRFLNGLEGILSEQQARIEMVVSNPAKAVAEENFLRTIADGRVEGWIIPAGISPSVRSALKRSRTPKVLLHYPDEELSPHFFERDSRQLGTQIGSHLLEEGYRCVTVFAVVGLFHLHQQFIAVLKDVLARGGAALRVHTLPHGGATGGAAACRSLLHQGESFDAVVCDDDDIAFGVIQALKENGRTPPDIGVIGAGDFPAGSLMEPPLTTVSFPYYQVGREVARLLMDLLLQHPVEAAHRTFLSKLIVRSSSQKISSLQFNPANQPQSSTKVL